MNKKVINNWYELKNEGLTPELLVYGYIGQYNEVNFADFSAAIKNLNSKKLTVRVHSGGGSVFDGLPIYDALKSSGLDITVIIDGLAASMASVISQVAAKGKRTIQKSGNIMIHRVKGAEYGNSDEMRAYADMMDVQEKRIKAIFMETTGQPEEVVDSWFSKGVDFWIDAETALTLGLVDKVIDGDATKLPINKLKQMGEEAAYNALSNSLENISQNLKTDMNKLQVLLMAGLAARGISVVENATEEQTAQTIANAFKALDDKILELNNKIKDNAETQADALVNAAEAAGKIKADDTEGKKDLKDLALVNYAMASKMVDKMAGTHVAAKNVVVNIGTGVGTGGPADPKNNRANWTFKDWSQKDSKGLMEMKVSEPTNFSKLFEAEYGTPYA